MPLTWLDAKNALAQFAGNGGMCPTDPRVGPFVRDVLQQMLFSGTHGNLRKFCFRSSKGCITVPYELEVPLKVRIDNRVGTVWDKWYEFHATKDFPEDCLPAGQALIEDPNYYPIIGDLPPGGARIAVTAVCRESDDAHVIVKGVDPTGREIITAHNGQQIVGEYLTIRQNATRYTQATFGRVDAVYKTKTHGYVQLYWLNVGAGRKGFLADYSPLETTPAYRRFQLTLPECHRTDVTIEVLGRIRLKPEYTDTDIIPFENTFALKTTALAINASVNNAPGLAQQHSAMADQLINKENDFKKVQNGSPIEFFLATSGGSVKNIIP